MSGRTMSRTPAARPLTLPGPRGAPAVARRRPTTVLGLVVLGSLVAVLFAAGGWSATFDSARWIGDPKSRGRMLADLKANHLRAGMTATEVCALLGPDDMSHQCGVWSRRAFAPSWNLHIPVLALGTTHLGAIPLPYPYFEYRWLGLEWSHGNTTVSRWVFFVND